jgi:tRNA(Ile)-lysidine synthase
VSLSSGAALGAAEFAALMAPLGPFEPLPQLAVAVSGGADSMALALLADGWARGRGGSVLGLIVDHGLRVESAGEAEDTRRVLTGQGIAARVLRITGLARGPALAARARTARYALLRAACAEAGIVHLLIGHHAADQAETVILRALARSGPAGLAGMAGLVEEAGLRLLRPLLSVPPARLRATLAAARVGWAEDPSNADGAFSRPRLRALRRDREGAGPATAALLAAAQASGVARTRAEAEAAWFLGGAVAFRPEGFALLPARPMPPAALGAVVAAVGGRAWAPARAAVAALAEAPRPATLAGVRLMAAGRLGPGFLVVREPAAMGPAVRARPGACWDGRFRLAATATPPEGALIGSVGKAAASLRKLSALPASVLETLPALWVDGCLAAVPHLDWPNPLACAGVRLLFAPARAAAPAIPPAHG